MSESRAWTTTTSGRTLAGEPSQKWVRRND
jgi:hypothetical protein